MLEREEIKNFNLTLVVEDACIVTNIEHDEFH